MLTFAATLVTALGMIVKWWFFKKNEFAPSG